MNYFQISTNDYLSKHTDAYYHVRYTRMGKPGNPNYLNDLKNTYNDFSKKNLIKLRDAEQALREVLQIDLPNFPQFLTIDPIVVCVVPRAKAEGRYHANQQLFRATVQSVVNGLSGFVDGTSYLLRHTNTKTTHLRKPIPNYDNDGPEPYPGITEATCTISSEVENKDILLIDDIYTPGVNIDEDAIEAILNAGAHTVTFYSVGKVQRD